MNGIRLSLLGVVGFNELVEATVVNGAGGNAACWFEKDEVDARG